MNAIIKDNRAYCQCGKLLEHITEVDKYCDGWDIVTSHCYYCEKDNEYLVASDLRGERKECYDL